MCRLLRKGEKQVRVLTRLYDFAIIQSSTDSRKDGKGIEMQTLNDLMEMAKSANGKARQRTIGKAEATEILKLVERADDSVHTIRVYSHDGFVPNSYKYRCEIRYFEATRKDGELVIRTGYCDAKRSRGEGAIVTINGRAAQ